MATSAVTSSTTNSNQQSTTAADAKARSLALEQLRLNNSVDAQIIGSISGPKYGDSVSLNKSGLAQGLSELNQKVIDKLNEILAKDLPEGIASLKPEEYTPEKTAQRIVDGISGLYAAFSKQNPKLTEEESITKFMELARKGVQSGYDSAYATLKDVGAIDINGVEDGIVQTKNLIEQKLKGLEDYLRKGAGLATSADASTGAQATLEASTSAATAASISVKA